MGSAKPEILEFEGANYSDVLDIKRENDSTVLVESQHSIGTISIAMSLLANIRKLPVIIVFGLLGPECPIWVVMPGDPPCLLAERWHSNYERISNSKKRV